MFKIESYVTPILLSYVDKYVRDFKPADAQVSLWGGGVALHNLVLKADVLQQEVSLPFTLVSGRIHELLIQVPWTKIMSEPIVVTIDTIECVLSLNPPDSTVSQENMSESQSRNTQLVEAPPGYMQALVRRIVSNIALKVHHLIVKYVQDDIVLSLNVKHLSVDSAGANWEPAFADIDQAKPVVRRLMRLDDLTLCLDQTDSDGKIRFYQEPLLYRCQLDFRILTTLVSANSRRASGLGIQLRSSKLAWGVTGNQLTMLIRLVRERPLTKSTPLVLPPKSTEKQSSPLHAQTGNTAEPTRTGSWSEWAWSWLPTLGDKEHDVEETPAPAAPVPLHFAAYLDDVSFAFKVIESDTNNRRRPRSVLELTATHTAFKSYMCIPTTIRMKIGTRNFALLSKGKCICGHMGYHALLDEPVHYIKKKVTEGDQQGKDKEWKWPVEDLSEVLEKARAEHEKFIPTEDLIVLKEPEVPEEPGKQVSESPDEIKSSKLQLEQSTTEGTTKPKDKKIDFWTEMAPQFSVEFIHERAPPMAAINPYENPPKDFQYSDWIEVCDIKVQLQPTKVTVSMSLIHRLQAISGVFEQLPSMPVLELPRRTLTIEECEALIDNLPQRRVNIEVAGFHVRVLPWDHALYERPSVSPLVLDVESPNIVVIVNGPLYPHRVCDAACQMPKNAGAIWHGARLHITVNIKSIEAKVCSVEEPKAKPCGRADIQAVFHVLLNKEFFAKRDSVVLAYSVKIDEANICGSMARLLGAWQVPWSLMTNQISAALKLTTLAMDALDDEEAVAIDMSLEELLLRGFFTQNTTTHVITLQSAKAMALHEIKGNELKQAWLFSGPDTPTSTPYLRVALQYCKNYHPESVEYMGLWAGSTAVAVDPLFIAWLAYRPTLKPDDMIPSAGSMKSLSSQFFLRRRAPGTSSSGRGASKSGSGAEVHMPGRSVGSSERADDRRKSDSKPKSSVERYWISEYMLAVHERLKRMHANLDVGLTLVYVNMVTASALDCHTLRDALDRHAANCHDVLALSVGRVSMYSNTLTKNMWSDIRHDGPTTDMKSTKPKGTDAFPWKLIITEIYINTLEASKRSSDDAKGLRSNIRTFNPTIQSTVLEHVSSTVTLSLVAKRKQITKHTKKQSTKKEKELSPEEVRFKYFSSGVHFKPTSLKEFVRGPAQRLKATSEEAQPEVTETKKDGVFITAGPVVSLGVHIHADTPPLTFKLEHEKVHIIAAAVHCFAHILVLLKRSRLQHPRGETALSRSLLKMTTASEDAHSASNTSEEKSDLIPIFEAQSVKDMESADVKTFLWFQWVVSRISVVATSNKSKLALEVDDIISSVDLQSYYNQFKIKIASACMKHYSRTGDNNWTAGVLGGRVLEAREPTNAKEENHFLGITITQAQIGDLPPSWREELHPKLLEGKRKTDSMWEVYATLAALEAVIQPQTLNQIISLVLDMAPRSYCPLAKYDDISKPSHWPFCYVSAGGLRLLLTVQDEESDQQEDDTFMFVIGKITVNPHPENPICRRLVNPSTESSWAPTSGPLDGQQYEIMIKNLALRCAQFYQLVSLENIDQETAKGTASENPAVKWNQKVVMPTITPILHSVDFGCILAPAMFINHVLTCGPAVEFNLVSDCSIEISVDQVLMAQKFITNMTSVINERRAANILKSVYYDQLNICPYADILVNTSSSESSLEGSKSILAGGEENLKIPHDDNLKSTNEENLISSNDIYHGADSGVDVSSTSKLGLATESGPSTAKKSVSITFADQLSDASQFLEVFVTMGTIEISFYIADDGSAEIGELRAPLKWRKAPIAKSASSPTEESEKRSIRNTDGSDLSHSTKEVRSVRSLTETDRDVDIGMTTLDYEFVAPRKAEGNIPLVTVTLKQPNLYYWRRVGQKSIQVSLFDAWLGLGAGVNQEYWYATLLSTEKGTADPVTDIAPALATMKIITPTTGSPGNAVVRGSMRLDIERPVLLEISSDRLRRVSGTFNLVKNRMSSLETSPEMKTVKPSESATTSPLLYQLRRFLVSESIESATMQTTQIGLNGSQGAIGWDAMSLQVGASGRPDRFVGRMLVTAALISSGNPGDSRHLVMQPVMIGAELEASWEAWRRVEGGLTGREPTVRVCVDIDYVELDLRPCDLVGVTHIRDAINVLMEEKLKLIKSADQDINKDDEQSMAPPLKRVSLSSTDATEEHFYKDDLRSGAFKIVRGGQLPMAYQVTLHNNSVSWRYPHPRAITRLVIFPLPGTDEEIPCILELYSMILNKWQSHTLFSIPVGEPRELQLYIAPPDAVCAQMWRFRVLENEAKEPPFQFNINKYIPRDDPLAYEQCDDVLLSAASCGVTAEQLSGVVRVDSCFSPRLSPRLRVVVRFANLAVYLNNSLPKNVSRSTSLEGYYVSKPLSHSHRVLALCARSAEFNAQLSSPAGALLLLNTTVMSDIMECATGTMEQLVEEFQIRGALSLPNQSQSRARVAFSRINVALHMPRLRTLEALAADWKLAINTTLHGAEDTKFDTSLSNDEPDDTEEGLEGRVSLWIHNSTASALRIGQEGTEDIVPIGPGVNLAYRWRSPTAPKKLRFALVGPSNWSWSSSIPFTLDHYRVRLLMDRVEDLGSCKPSPIGAAFLYMSVEEKGSRLVMQLAGRLRLANMLRFNLLYKVRTRCNETNQWRTVCSSELQSESAGRTVICGADCEMSLKIKFTATDTGWSGDIPLKECPKENVPWLVKVPCEGDMPYMSVWARVVRSRTDGRVMATIWPLFVLYSHLSLDTDVLIETESDPNTEPPPILVQAAPGRGSCTHLLAPGTTAARHNLSLQYRNIECPVTKEAVPLHYGMTQTSVFDKKTHMSLEDVLSETLQWLERSGKYAVSEWPYSIVAKHWPAQWKPSLAQPRCDVIVVKRLTATSLMLSDEAAYGVARLPRRNRFNRAWSRMVFKDEVQYLPVRIGGGCSLEVQLRPAVILCNAAPIALTLRAHDAAPLCKLDPGTAISPPSNVLSKPFFISVEIGRETFVSGELCVTSAELGVYGTPPPGRLALGVPSYICIHCNHKVALLTMHYEIKENINILGMTSTYMIINRLNSDILMTAMAVSNDDETVTLRPSTYMVIAPTEPDSVYGTSISKFWVSGRMLLGTDPSELRLFMCLSLPNAPETRSVPVRLAQPPFRRPISLTDEDDNSVPVVVTQSKHEGRWVVTVSPDPCPQFIVHNNTSGQIAIAQPIYSTEEPHASKITIYPECAGTKWFRVLRPNTARHYSTPGYCLRYPPTAESTPSDITFLTFSRVYEADRANWCGPVAATDGEQLLQLADCDTVKMRLRNHPHSSHLELCDVDEHDISASDIRRRLLGAFSSQHILGEYVSSKTESEWYALHRIGGVEKLLEPAADERSVLSSQIEPINPGPAAEQASESKKALETVSGNPSTVVLFATARESIDLTEFSKGMERGGSYDTDAVTIFPDVPDNEWDETASWFASDRVRLFACSVVVQLAALSDSRPLIALHLDRPAIVIKSDSRRMKTTLSIADVQIDNLQYESGQYDFAVVASTRGEPPKEDHWPPLWNLFAENSTFAARHKEARALLRLTHVFWTVLDVPVRELSEVEARLGPLALYIEDAYVTALVKLARSAQRAHGSERDVILISERTLRSPLRLRLLYLHPLDLTLTLHTAVRMYIALDHSPLRLSAFKLTDVMTSAERLTHSLTVHYLSAAILGAGWVVGGLELLGAPGALAARVGGATGGVRGVASAAAAALLRSLSAWAGSLARNLDLLAGDEEHARRAAAARRRPPQSFMGGLAAGLTNFAINILGAVGGLAHHPVVGVAVGESESGATALRRSLIGALTKPLSATADLVAYAGQGLLSQTGWDPIPQPRCIWSSGSGAEASGWRRDCVRWTFRLAEIPALAGYQVLLDGTPVHLIFTHKFLVLADPESDRIIEMIDFKFCTLGPYQGQIIELAVVQRRLTKTYDTKPNLSVVDEDDNLQVNAAAMARVARYTGVEQGSTQPRLSHSLASDSRVLSFLPAPGRALALHASLAAIISHNSATHISLL